MVWWCPLLATFCLAASGRVWAVGRIQAGVDGGVWTAELCSLFWLASHQSPVVMGDS